MKVRHIIAAAFAAIALAVPSFAQDVVTTPAPVSTSAPIPHYVRYSGSISESGSKPVQMRFALYENQTGGQPVWSEIQTVNPVEGKYAVLLGAGTENGLPQSVFSAAQARWLGITIGAGQEQPRTILLATPYSLESSDAQTLAGHPASDFVLAGSNSGSNPAPKSDTKKPNTNTDISLIDVTSGLTINNGGTGPTVTMGIDATKVPFLASANTFTATQTISAGNLAIPATTSKTNGVITSGGKAIFQSYSSVSGANNLFLGAGSGNFSNSGKNNTGVGNVSLSALTTAAGNMALGTDSLGKTTSGPYNTAIGAFAGYYNITGGYNTFIGNSAGPPSGSSALTNATAIGASSVVNESNAVVLGGTGAYAVSVGIGTATPQYTLDVQGTGNFTGAVNYAGAQTYSGIVTMSNTLYNEQANANVYDALFYNTGTESGGLKGEAQYIGLGGYSDDTTSGDLSVGTAGYSSNPTGQGVVGENTAQGGTAAGVYGDLGIASTIGASQISLYEGAGIWADGGDNTSGASRSLALLASSDADAAGVFINGNANYYTLFSANEITGGYPFGAINTIDGGQCIMDSVGDFTCSGTVGSVVHAKDSGKPVAVHGITSPENWIEDFGSGSLSGGAMHISFDPGFLATVNTSVGYHVFLTPKGDSKGLYVTNEGPAGFDVRESNGGTSDIAFDYRIVGKRNGLETARLEDMTATEKILKKQISPDPDKKVVQPVHPNLAARKNSRSTQ